MNTLNLNQLSLLESVMAQLPYDRRLDPAKQARRARRDASFNNSIRAGIRHARKVRVFMKGVK